MMVCREFLALGLWPCERPMSVIPSVKFMEETLRCDCPRRQIDRRPCKHFALRIDRAERWKDVWLAGSAPSMATTYDVSRGKAHSHSSHDTRSAHFADGLETQRSTPSQRHGCVCGANFAFWPMHVPFHELRCWRLKHHAEIPLPTRIDFLLMQDGREPPRPEARFGACS